MEGGREKLRKRGFRLFPLPSSHRPLLACYFSIIAIFIGIASGNDSTEETVIDSTRQNNSLLS